MSHATTIDFSQEVEGVVEFTPEELGKIEAIKNKYPDSKAAIMPVMWLAQRKWGWLSKRVMEYIGEVLNLEYAHVYGVATFYTMYFKKPMGKFHVQVCTNVSCMLRGGEELYKQVCNHYGISHLDRTTDGLVSIEEVECMGACGGAPMIAINEDYHENMTQELFSNLLAGLK